MYKGKNFFYLYTCKHVFKGKKSRKLTAFAAHAYILLSRLSFQYL